jgi:hypothetical protein
MVARLPGAKLSAGPGGYCAGLLSHTSGSMNLFHRAALLVLLSAIAIPAHAQAVHAFVDVTVIPLSDERLLEHQTVITRGVTIVELGPSNRVVAPADAIRIDGRNRFLIPGLGDAHVHLSTPGGTPELAERALTLLALNGVTMARSMYTEPSHVELVNRMERDGLLFPRLRLASPPLSGQGATSPAAAAGAVRDHAAAGYAMIKIMPGLSRATFDSAAAEARRLKIPIVGHVPGDVGLAHALESGYASIEHLDGLMEALLPSDGPVPASRSGFFGIGILDAVDLQRTAEVVRLVKAAGVTIVPTESGMEMFVSMDSGRVLAQRHEMRFVSPAERRLRPGCGCDAGPCGGVSGCPPAPYS